MRWDKLEGTVVGGDSLLEGGAGLVVNNVEHWGPVGGSQMCVHVVVGGNAVGILFGCKWAYKDGIAAGVHGDHDVLIATVGAWVELSSVVGEDAVDWDLVEFDSVGSSSGSGGRSGWCYGCCPG
jgi:hypothetical protein